LRDDPHWQAHYNAILTGLYSRFEEDESDYDSAKEAFEAFSAHLEHLTFIAYQGANHAHCYTHRAEPFTDEEIAAFNASVNVSKNGEGQQ
jgi:hypothetical protein